MYCYVIGIVVPQPMHSLDPELCGWMRPRYSSTHDHPLLRLCLYLCNKELVQMTCWCELLYRIARTVAY